MRELYNFLPLSNKDQPPTLKSNNDPIDRDCQALDHIIPLDSSQPYDMKHVIDEVIDNSNFWEIQADYAKNIICGFARINGQPVGIVGNQPKVAAGCLDINASVKAARFVRFCDAFKNSTKNFKSETVKNLLFLCINSQCPSGHLCRCAWIFTRYRARIRRNHSSRCQITLRLRGSHRS